MAPSGPRLRVVPALMLAGWGFPDTDIDLSSAFFGLGSFVANAFGWVLDLVTTAVRAAINDLANFAREAFRMGQQIVDSVIYNVGALTTTAAGLVDGAWEMAKTIAVLVPDTFRAALDGVETIIWKLLQTWLPDVLREVGSMIAGLVREALGGLWDALEWLGDAWPILRDNWGVLYKVITAPYDFVMDIIGDRIWDLAGPLWLKGLEIVNPALAFLITHYQDVFPTIVKLLTDPGQFAKDASHYIITQARDEIETMVIDNLLKVEPMIKDVVEAAFGLA